MISGGMLQCSIFDWFCYIYPSLAAATTSAAGSGATVDICMGASTRKQQRQPLTRFGSPVCKWCNCAKKHLQVIADSSWRRAGRQ